LAADRLAFDRWRKEIQPGHWLLDVGCAEGRSTFKLIDLDLNIAGFDVSRRLVRQAIDRYRRQHYPVNANFFCADATKIPLANEVMNYVLIYGVLHHVPNPSETCREVVRILKPGGVYFGSENNTTIFRGIFDLIQRLIPIWHEEAGPEALLSKGFFRNVFKDQPIHFDSRTSVFLPPHLVNWMGKAAGYRILSATDKAAACLPYIKAQGGLIVIRAEKTTFGRRYPRSL
jgi:ubiquinone/menaquinone biosynthesis C-methylase UbiE